MNKADLERQIELLVGKNKGMSFLIHEIKKFIETNLSPFRDNIADCEDERNKGILAVLNVLVDIYNKYASRFDKIKPLEAYKCEVMKFYVNGKKSKDS